MSEYLPTISAIVVTRNEQGTIRRCIESLLGQSVPVHEIIVVDGNSTDFTRRYVADLQRKHSRVRMIIEERGEPRRGPAAARNIGASVAVGELLLFMNGDISIGPDYVAMLLRSMEDPGLDATAGLRWNVRTSLVGGLANVQYALSHNTQPETLAAPAFLTGDAMLVRAESFWAAGGYDPGMPAGEDADLGYRMQANGSRIGYTPKATVWHEGRNHRSFADWVSQLQWHGRGAAALALAHRWRLDRERDRFKRHFLLPLSTLFTVLLVVFVLASVSGILFSIAAAAVTTVAALKYLRTAIGVQRQCAETPLPTMPLPQDILLYPLFRMARFGLLAFFTWRALLVSEQVERKRHAGGDAL